MGKAAETGDLRTDPCFFGRAGELQSLVHNLALGRHTLCVGPKGIGKSRLIQEAIAVLNGARPMPVPVAPAGLRNEMLFQRVKAGARRVMVVTRTTPLGDCLVEMAAALHAAACLRVRGARVAGENWESLRRKLKRLGGALLQEAVLESIRASHPPWLIAFDSLDRISPTHIRLFEDLLASAVVCAAVVRPRDAPLFRKIWASFVRLEIDPLSRQESLALIDHCLRRYRMSVADPPLYRAEVFKICGGNPFHIRNVLWMGSRNVHVDSREITRLRAQTGDDLFNMGPVYILAASVLTLSKIFSIGTDNREFYIYFSALGFLVYLVFRVFRTFFLFRPQRHR